MNERKYRIHHDSAGAPKTGPVLSPERLARELAHLSTATRLFFQDMGISSTTEIDTPVLYLTVSSMQNPIVLDNLVAACLKRLNRGKPGLQFVGSAVSSSGLK